MKAKPAPTRRETQVDLPPLVLEGRIELGTVDQESRTVSMVWSTGAGVPRRRLFGEPFMEELSLDKAHVRLERLASGRAPVLNAHGQWDLRDVIGVVESASIEKGEGRAIVRFSQRADVEPIWRDVVDGILKNVSVGYRVYRFEDGPVPTEKNALQVKRAVDWEPMEVSLVPIGADADAVIRSDSDRYAPNTCVLVETRASVSGETIMDPETVAREEEARRAAAESERKATEETRKLEIEAAAKRGAELERKRQVEIRAACKKGGVPSEFAERLVASEVTLDQARAEILDERARIDAEVDVSGARAEVGEEHATKVRSGIEGALAHRIGLEKTVPETGRSFRSMSMLRMAEELLALRGIETRGLDRLELVGTALRPQFRAGMHSTSDFANILGVLSNKSMRKAYEEAPRTFLGLSRRRSVNDFRDINVVQMDTAPDLELVGEHGEFKYGTIGDSKEVYAIASYGKIFALTRQAIVNDDTDAFGRIPQLFGRAAARLEEDLFWANITGNAVMSDGVGIFHANHANLSTGVLAIAGLSAARLILRQQTDPAGNLLNITGRHLVVPAALETTAQQLTVQIQAQTTGAVNPFVGSFSSVIAQPRLDVASAVQYYLFADPMEIDTFEHAYLEGREGVYMETREGFEVDGVEFKARHDFGTAPVEFRGVVRSSGA